MIRYIAFILITATALLWVSCGGMLEPGYRRYSNVTPIPESILAIINQHCATPGCHAQGNIVDLTKDAESLRATKSLSEIENGEMPIPGSAPDIGFADKRQEFVDFLKGKGGNDSYE